MADVGSSIFNKKASDKLKSPDDLDKYLRVTNPSVWVILGACILLLVGLLAWGVFGAVSTSVSAPAAEVDGKVVSFLASDEASKVAVGDTANVDGTQMSVAEISTVPMSRNEAAAQLQSDYLVSTLVPADWTHMITFEGDTGEFTPDRPMTAVITVERVAPISLIFGDSN